MTTTMTTMISRSSILDYLLKIYSGRLEVLAISQFHDIESLFSCDLRRYQSCGYRHITFSPATGEFMNSVFQLVADLEETNEMISNNMCEQLSATYKTVIKSFKKNPVRHPQFLESVCS